MSDRPPKTHALDPAAPSHGYPTDHPETSQKIETKDSTASHPSRAKPDPTTGPAPSSHLQPPKPSIAAQDAAEGGVPRTAAPPTGTTEFTDLKVKLQNGLRQFPDFPSPGVLFEDIMPLFASHELHSDLIRALELMIVDVFGTTAGEKSDVDVIVGLESRGFLFGPTLALRFGAGFVPLRKKGKLPGQCETEAFEKEYGADYFQIQSDAIKKGQKVVVVDDIIATGGSASAAGRLVRKLGGELLGYVFMMELDFLKGRDQLDAPVHTLFSGQEDSLKKEG